ncbi:MAG: dTMP kinase [Proteobacteria bacterium]|nr:dTMP kinase [Pseudomonadota bacterium]
MISAAASPGTVAASGRLVALEGIDGSGTTTQTRLLVDALARRSGPQRRAAGTCEPSRGPLGRLLREALTARPSLDPGAMALVFAADRLDHWTREIAPLLREGVDVVTDRYVYSSLAYQSVFLPESWVFAINARAPEPCLTIYLQLDSTLAAQRRQRRGGVVELYETEAIQSAVAARYDALLGPSAALATWQRGGDGRWRRCGSPRSQHGRVGDIALIDASRSAAAVQGEIAELVAAALREPRSAGA